jgi:helicase MOV-10
MRRQHQAMDKSHLLKNRQLFPLGVVSADAASFGVMRAAGEAFKMFNPLISNNEKQLQAVGAILLRPPGSTPFIIFGPYVFFSFFQ